VSVLIDTTYTARVATPSFSPAGGTYVGGLTVTIGVTTQGAVIHFTIDGSAPTLASPVYAGPLPIGKTTIVRAAAFASGMTASDEAVAAYHVRVASPAFSAPGGTYDQPQTISIRTTTAGATIYFTTDGSAPTTSSTVYTSPISIPRTMTVRAI